MGKYLVAALLAGASMPVQALDLTAYVDMTQTTAYNYDWEVSESLGIIPLKISGSRAEMLTGTSPDLLYYYDSLQAYAMGSTLFIELRPDFFLMGGFSLTLNFDQAITPGFSNLSALNLVSGNLSVRSTGRYFPETPVVELNGPVVSLAVNAPEPASWALMIGGFALAGGAMRRRRYQVAFA